MEAFSLLLNPTIQTVETEQWIVDRMFDDDQAITVIDCHSASNLFVECITINHPLATRVRISISRVEEMLCELFSYTAEDAQHFTHRDGRIFHIAVPGWLLTYAQPFDQMKALLHVTEMKQL